MNDQREGRWPEDPDGPDPVAAFFARERADIRPEPGGDLQWHHIVGQARGSRRHGWVGYAAGAVAAAAVAAAVAVSTGPGLPGLTGQHGLTPATRSSSLAAPSPGQSAPSGSPKATTAPTGSDTGSPTVAAPAPSVSPTTAAAAVPASFVAQSLTTAATSQLYAMGTSSCGDRLCPTLVGSSDRGATWHTVRVFADAATASPQAQGWAQDPSTLSQVRFASPRVGWVYGGGLKVTRDGGATWHDYAHPGQVVLDLETDGRDVVITSADDCADGVCAGPVQVTRESVGADPQTTPSATGPAGGSIADAQTLIQDREVFVVPQWRVPPVGDAGPSRLDGSTLEPLGRPTGCGGGGSARYVATTASTTTARIFGLCSRAGDGRATGGAAFEVSASDDAGGRWQTVSRRPLRLPGSVTVSVAASDDRHLVAASVGIGTGGDAAVRAGASLQVSSDGGRTWHAPKAGPLQPAGGWEWVGAPGGPQFYAVSGQDGSYWHSSDDGETWERVPIADQG